MRIIAGRFKGRRLKPPKGRSVRPTTDRIREAMFNLIAHRARFDFSRARVADFFAGSGALGLEALSRGAAHVTFVEKSRGSIELLKANIALLDAADSCRIVAASVRQLPRVDRGFDLILADPPYGRGLAEVAIKNASERGWMLENTLIVVEMGREEIFAPPAAYARISEHVYGNSKLILLRTNDIDS